MRLTLMLALFTAAVAAAQWINYPTPATPRTRDGKANLSAGSALRRQTQFVRSLADRGYTA
jgi:hypothetical protein